MHREERRVAEVAPLAARDERRQTRDGLRELLDDEEERLAVVLRLAEPELRVARPLARHDRRAHLSRVLRERSTFNCA